MSAWHPENSTARTQARRWLWLWFLAGLTAFVIAVRDLGGSLVGGIFVPSDYDSFYHARRILDAVSDLTHFYQFDPRIHAPEGSWVTWPWAYDLLCAFLVKAALTVGLTTEPMSALALLAPLSVFLSAGLLAFVCRQLQLSWPAASFVMLAFASSQLTRALHRVGMVDHHYVEQIFVLGTLAAGLAWLSEPANRGRAATIGILLGLAPAFHNGDFILQLPVLATLAVLWLLGRAITLRAIAAFAASLVLVTMVMLLPSEPFRKGMFSYTLLSWFHLYVAVATAGFALLLATLRRSARAALFLLVLAGLTAAPLVAELRLATEFLGGSLEQLDQMAEVRGPLYLLLHGELHRVVTLYSCLLWLLPLGLGWVLWRAWRRPEASALFLAVFSLFGTALLLLQFRLHYFGSFLLWLGPALLLQEWLGKRLRPNLAQPWQGVGAVLLSGAMLPGVLALNLPTPLGGAASYQYFRPLFLFMHDQCETAPGVILANNNLGHYLTYHTRCAVIANNFILTRQHEEKLRLANELLRGTTQDLPAQAPWVRYVLVERLDEPFHERCFPACAANAGLRHELLESGGVYPPGWELVAETEVIVEGQHQPFARVFAVPRSAGGSDASRAPSPDSAQ